MTWLQFAVLAGLWAVVEILAALVVGAYLIDHL